MEKRALLASALSIVVLMLYFTFFGPESVPTPPGPPVDPAREAAGTEPETGVVPEEPATDAVPVDSPAEAIEAEAVEEFRVRTATQDLRFTNVGGRIAWWRLPAYQKEQEVPVELIPPLAEGLNVLPLQVEIPGDPNATAALARGLHVHEVTDLGPTDPSGYGPGKRVSFEWADGRGLHVAKSLTLPDSDYECLLEVEVTRDGRPVPARIVWASGLGEPPKDNTRHIWHVQGQAVIATPQRIERLGPDDVVREEVAGARAGRPIAWAGLESTYFTALAFPSSDGQPPPDVVFTQRGDPEAGETDPHLTAAAQTDRRASIRMFVGPKDYKLLESKGFGLERVIDFSSYTLLYAITKYLFLALTRINEYVGNYGWSIILLTFLVRLVFFPITYRSMINMRQSSKKMAKVQPKVRAIQEHYRKAKRTMESQREMNDKIMALYRKEGVNPMASVTGCLPLLLQMPIFIGFYNLLAVTIEVRQAPFIGWIHDLSSRDPYYITPLLMGVSWLLQQAMTSSAIPDPMQRRMMYLMPVVFTFMMMNMPSGLVLYWFTSNLIGMGQQYLINRRADAMAGQGSGEAGGQSGKESPSEKKVRKSKGAQRGRKTA